MNTEKNRILLILVILSMGSSVYFYIRISKLESKNLQLTKQAMIRKDKSGREIDTYIKGQVKNTITKKSKSILKCYKVYLKKEQADMEKRKFVREGNVSLDWHIDRNGDVVSPEIIHSGIPDDMFQKCLVDTILKWKFPPPPFGGKKYVEHIFRFMDKEK
jgi:hypothetical protein